MHTVLAAERQLSESGPLSSKNSVAVPNQMQHVRIFRFVSVTFSHAQMSLAISFGCDMSWKKQRGTECTQGSSLEYR